MPTKKLTAVSIPHLVEGEWYDAALPGLILRVGVKRRTWQFRYHAGGCYHRNPPQQCVPTDLVENFRVRLGDSCKGTKPPEAEWARQRANFYIAQREGRVLGRFDVSGK